MSPACWKLALLQPSLAMFKSSKTNSRYGLAYILLFNRYSIHQSRCDGQWTAPARLADTLISSVCQVLCCSSALVTSRCWKGSECWTQHVFTSHNSDPLTPLLFTISADVSVLLFVDILTYIVLGFNITTIWQNAVRNDDSVRPIVHKDADLVCVEQKCVTHLSIKNFLKNIWFPF